jgi:hypothetical protein
MKRFKQIEEGIKVWLIATTLSFLTTIFILGLILLIVGLITGEADVANASFGLMK